MPQSATVSKIQKAVTESIFSELDGLSKCLSEGDVYSFEQQLSRILLGVQNTVSQLLMTEAATELLQSKLVQEADQGGFSKLVVRPLSVCISTGHVFDVPSLYARKTRKTSPGPRHMLARYWKLIEGSTISYVERVSLCGVLAPSYDIANQLLRKMGVEQGQSKVRKTLNALADFCAPRETVLGLAPQESLAGKRVVISIDGGRTRTRFYNGNLNESGHERYDSSWREPKLFVIEVLDEQGGSHRSTLPLYGCRFAEQDVLAQLRSSLKALGIEKAKQVQLIADGAAWIWTQLPELLHSLGVKESNIVQTLDYYHAAQYVHKLIEALPA